MVCNIHSFLEVLRKVGYFNLLAHILCISFFSYQTFRLVPNIISPTKTHTSVKQELLKDIDFPLDIKICVDPAVNLTTLEGFGYYDIEEYIAGSSFRSNLSLYGWGGQKGVRKVHKTKIVRIAKAAQHMLHGKSSFNVSFVFPFCPAHTTMTTRPFHENGS